MKEVTQKNAIISK
jgi:hypothetical protein